MSEHTPPTPEQGQSTSKMPDKQSLGIAGSTAKAFIHSPLSPLLFIAMLVMGLLGLALTPRQEDPQISVPVVDLLLSYPGASAEQVESLAISPLERVMSEMPGVDHVYSMSRRGSGIVTIQFVVGEKIGPSLVKVHDKIQSNLNKLPPGVNPPLVAPKGIDDVPVVTLTMWSDKVDDGVLRSLGLDVLHMLKQIPDTGSGFVAGGRPEQIRVQVRPEKLSGYGLSLDQIAQTIRTANAETETGSIEYGRKEMTVYSGSFLRTANDVSRLVVGTHRNSPIYLSDVADVRQGPGDPKQLTAFYTGPAYQKALKADGSAAVTVAVAKKEGSNGVTVANAILEMAETLKGDLIPPDVHVDVTRNYGVTADEKVKALLLKLVIATGIVTILVLFALGLRPAVVVTVVIPVVVLITVFGALVMGYSIDRVSLFALIFSIGILVDDAIVVVENMYRRWLMAGSTDTDTAVDSVREVGNPTILATFTVIAALLPMGFVRGMMGPYMEPIPALASVAMFFSLIAAFVFTPWLAMWLRPSMEGLRKAEEKEHKGNERIARFFDRTLVPLIQNRALGWITLFAIIACFFLSVSLFYFQSVPVKMLPFDNKGEFSIVVDMPEGTALPDTASLTHTLAEELRAISEVVAMQTYVGTARPFDFNGMVRHYYLRSKPWQAEIQVQLTHKKTRKLSSHKLAEEARRLLTPIARRAGARITIAEMPPGPPVLQSVVAEIYGMDNETRRDTAQRMTDLFTEVEAEGMLADVDNYMQQPYTVMRFEVNGEKAVRNGISVDTINRNLGLALGDAKLGDVKRGNVKEPTYIIMQIPMSVRAQPARLMDLPIPSNDGRTLPLAELGHFVEEKEHPILLHKDLRPVEYVVGDAVGRLGAPIYPMFRIMELMEERDFTAADGVELAPTYYDPPEELIKSGMTWAGEWTVTYETFRDMGAAFAAALVLIYILVVWQFGNFVIPGVIMAPIPLTLIGIVPGHWILGAEFTATSMIGFIALAGIIVRNSILLVDFAQQQVVAGSTVADAMVDACKTRTRPIMITALALVGGSCVILFDPIFQGMAISLLFGVLVSTLLTLVVIPLGCVSASRHLEESANQSPH